MSHEATSVIVYPNRGKMRTLRNIRVLVVEDFDPFRQLICSLVSNYPGFEVVGEASDGLEAIDKAQELTPDLILLDIGLPSLDGMQVARRLRNLISARIIFVCQDTSEDVIHAALDTGALAYIVKSRVSSELPPALQGVNEGSSGLTGGLQGN
jgi:DNA-binding NarL/FixJ family response regulator